MPGMKIECATEDCSSYYDGEDYGVVITWHCIRCSDNRVTRSRLFEKKESAQSVLQSESTDRVRVKFWMRWLRQQ